MQLKYLGVRQYNSGVQLITTMSMLWISFIGCGRRFLEMRCLRTSV